MGRDSASTRLRRVAAIGLCAALLTGRAAPAVRGQSLADRLGRCGDSFACADGGCFCGNLVTAAGGCASGDEMLWFRADYMLWQRDGVDLPPLVTASPLGTSDAIAGRLDQPDAITQVLAGGGEVGDDWRSGFGFEAGIWLNACTGWAIFGDYFNGGRDSYGLTIGPDSNRILARPYFDAETMQPSAALVNFPPARTGSTSVSAFDDFQGAGFSMQKCVWHTGNACTAEGASRLSVVGGYRYYHHDSLLFVGDDFTQNVDAGMIVAGTRVLEFDKFAGRNEFHGFELGLQGRIQRCRWWCDGLAMVALGGSRRVVFVEGETINLFPDNSFADGNGSLLTNAVTNIGRYTDDQPQAVPRFRLGAGWQATERLSIHLGYNLIIWNGVVQAADHLPPELAVDPRNLPGGTGGGPEPVFPGIRDTTMVAHGLDFGLEVWF